MTITYPASSSIIALRPRPAVTTGPQPATA